MTSFVYIVFIMLTSIILYFFPYINYNNNVNHEIILDKYFFFIFILFYIYYYYYSFTKILNRIILCCHINKFLNSLHFIYFVLYLFQPHFIRICILYIIFTVDNVSWFKIIIYVVYYQFILILLRNSNLNILKYCIFTIIK